MKLRLQGTGTANFLEMYYAIAKGATDSVCLFSETNKKFLGIQEVHGTMQTIFRNELEVSSQARQFNLQAKLVYVFNPHRSCKLKSFFTFRFLSKCFRMDTAFLIK